MGKKFKDGQKVVKEQKQEEKGNKIKISLIIPVYNVADELEECLNSILSQTLADIEIICVNDASTDDSLKILERYALRDQRIKLHTLEENSGAAVARNTGLAVARGEFVAFIDADDCYPSNDVLEVLYTNAKQQNVLICGGSFSSLKNGEIVTEYNGLNSLYVFQSDGLMRYQDYQFEFGYQRFIFNRDFIIKNRINFPDYRRFQDPPFFVKAMVTAGEFYAIAKIVYQYREDYKEIHWTPKKTMDLLQGVTELLEISAANNLNELHYRTYARLCNYTQLLYNALKEDAEYCIPYLIRANRAIDIPIVRFYDKSVDETFVVPALNIYLHSPLQKNDGTVPKVSVIIPIYKVEEFIVECVASVVNQTLKDIEIICVDDESPDNSIELIKKEFGQDKRIKIVRKKNGGLSSARNAGVRVATGEFIYFLDSDDYIDTNALEILYNEAKSYSLDVVIFDADSFSDERFTQEEEKAFMDRKVQGYLEYYHRKGDYSEIVEGQVLFLRMKAKNEHRSAVWLQFIRRDYYLEKGLDSYNGILHEDNLFTLKSILQAKRVKNVPFNFYHRRVRIGSIMTQKEGVKNLHGYFITYCEAFRFLLRINEKLYPRVRDAYINEMNAYIRSVRRISKLVSEEELQNFYNTLTVYEKILYDFIISVGKMEKIIDELGETQAKIEQKMNEIIVAHNQAGISNIDKLNGQQLKQSAEIAVAEDKRKGRLRRKAQGFFRCLKTHGFRYTFIRVFGGRERARQYEIKKQKKEILKRVKNDNGTK